MDTKAIHIKNGFTIIELMVVIAIIGILASISIPIYSDYVSRGKVSESIQLLGSTRVPLQEYWTTWGHWPALDTIGTKQAGKYTSHLFSGGEAPLLYVEAIMKGNSSEAGMAGKAVRMVYDSNENTWNCTTNGVLTIPIPLQFLPTPCR
jgi:prepilin-type N-terminal cleavage/methylation domain-containing protein